MAESKCYGISSFQSNSMKSSNPKSGIYEATTSRCLDLNGGNPACNQGGIVVLAAFEGNGSRPSHKGSGINDGEVMYTLNTTEVHGVVCEDYVMSSGQANAEITKGVCPTLTALHEAPIHADNITYVARRLTPTECARLQGMPDDWCADVPHSDSAEYKLWGNGIALPCILPMMKSMADLLREETTNEKTSETESI